MPGMYSEGEYDIAGFTVGVVDKKNIINGTTITPGDTVIGLASSGVHSNGFSLVRKLLLEQAGYDLHDEVAELGGKLGDTLLIPTKIYVKSLLALIEKLNVKGMAHITGGGFIENIPRMLPDNVNVNIDYGSWPILPVFQLMQSKGDISNRDMFTTFNMGIGLVLVVSKEDASEAVHLLHSHGEEAYIIGQVHEGESIVTFTGADV
ncbi:Phosphoribosylformylglycinamidine cyclo-ligase [compost metagenome]